jgi:hypothetical protein
MTQLAIRLQGPERGSVAEEPCTDGQASKKGGGAQFRWEPDRRMGPGNVARRPSDFTHPAVRHIRAHNPMDTQPRFVRSSATERQMMQNDAIIGTAR